MQIVEKFEPEKEYYTEERCHINELYNSGQTSIALARIEPGVTTSLHSLSETLEQYFGPAAKPSGSKPTKEQSALVQNYGGVFANQTLYYLKDEAGFESFAMFWPWGSGGLVTVKIFKQ